jgi:serine protease SohB
MAFLDPLKKLLPAKLRTDVPIVPVVRLTGVIRSGGGAAPGGSMEIASVADALERAFAFKHAPAVALIINSPGGSAVQSRLIHERIRSLAEEKDKTVLAFVEDAAASGGYMIACAADEIIADPSSIVGSIGVIAGGFGLQGAIEKLGVERRVHTAGERKGVLDPFQPERAEDVAHLEELLGDIHETFKDLVRERRGARLKPSEQLFSGLFWTGTRGLELGLVDAIGDLRGTLRARYGETVKPVVVNPTRPRFPFARLFGGQIGTDTLARDTVAAIEDRLAWNRLGL